MQVINNGAVYTDPYMCLKLQKFMLGKFACTYDEVRWGVPGTGALSDEQLTALVTAAGLTTDMDAGSNILSSDR